MKRRKRRVSCIDDFDVDTFFYGTMFNNDYIGNRLRCVRCFGIGAIWVDTSVLCPDCGYFDRSCEGLHDHINKYPRGRTNETTKAT